MATEADAAQVASDENSDASLTDGDGGKAAEPTAAELRTALDKLDKATTENKRLKGSLRVATAQVGQLDSFEGRVNKAIDDRMSVILDDSIDANAKRVKLAELAERTAAITANETRVTKAEPGLVKLLEDNDLDWESDELAEAKAAWDGNDLTAAIQLVGGIVTEKKLAGMLTTEEVKTVVETQLKNANLSAASVVDTEESGGGGGRDGEVPTFNTIADANAYMRVNKVTGEVADKIVAQVLGN